VQPHDSGVHSISVQPKLDGGQGLFFVCINIYRHRRSFSFNEFNFRHSVLFNSALSAVDNSPPVL
jgi:hypothetical protein